MKKVLVYPCGTEIGLEVYRALRYSKHYEVIGGIDNYDHGGFVFKNAIDNLPIITDDSNEKEIDLFEKAIEEHSIDLIYPAMDGVLAVFAKYRDRFKETLILPPFDTAEICRSKRMTYCKLQGVVRVPIQYSSWSEISSFPVFVKPDRGQGSVGARKIISNKELETLDFDQYVVMEYLPGKEYTVDCFTNNDGKLIYARGRGRRRIKNGISVNTIFEENPQFTIIAEKINSIIKQRGGWFFQLKEAADGELTLLEVSARIAGTSAISRNSGANLPLMTVDIFCGINIEDVALNNCYIELDRALENVYKTDITFSTVYIDYDDTIVQNGKLNTDVIKFLYQCVNNNKRLILISKHEGDLKEEIRKYRLTSLFDEIVHISRFEDKYKYIKLQDSIYIDDSYGERKSIKNACGIPVFDTHMIECLLES